MLCGCKMIGGGLSLRHNLPDMHPARSGNTPVLGPRFGLPPMPRIEPEYGRSAGPKAMGAGSAGSVHRTRIADLRTPAHSDMPTGPRRAGNAGNRPAPSPDMAERPAFVEPFLPQGGPVERGGSGMPFRPQAQGSIMTWMAGVLPSHPARRWMASSVAARGKACVLKAEARALPASIMFSAWR